MTHSGKMKSSASIFADRGDPWVTQREGREKFGRNLVSENPEMDAHLFASRQNKHVPSVIRAKPDRERPDDNRRRIAGMIMSTKRVISRPRDEKVSQSAEAILRGMKK